MSRNDEYTDISDAFFRITMKFQAIEKIPRDFGVKEPLFPSEIHMVQAIGETPGINVTELALRLGITKGAIPKRIKKLEQKNLVRRYQDDDNRKEVNFVLTDEGATAFSAHKKYHAKIDREIYGLMSSMGHEKLDIVRRLFTELDKYADRMLGE